MSLTSQVTLWQEHSSFHIMKCLKQEPMYWQYNSICNITKIHLTIIRQQTQMTHSCIKQIQMSLLLKLSELFWLNQILYIMIHFAIRLIQQNTHIQKNLMYFYCSHFLNPKSTFFVIPFLIYAIPHLIYFASMCLKMNELSKITTSSKEILKRGTHWIRTTPWHFPSITLIGDFHKAHEQLL
jgi:hypothetical protein